MIPKIIHQTYKSVDNLPPIYVKGQTAILKFHPDWEYRFWTDETMEAEMREKFPDIYMAWKGLPRMIMRIDIFRYCLMWEYGGLYADLDYIFRKSFDLLDSEVVLPISRNQSKAKYPKRFGNCVFASQPKHPFWWLLIQDILENPSRTEAITDTDVMDGENGTGPGFVTRIYYTCSEGIRANITVPERFTFHPPSAYTESEMEEKGSYGRHECASLWIKGAL